MRRGFTFVEILISMAIVAGMSLVLIATLRSGQQSWQVEEARMSVSLELRRSVDAMSRELANTQMGRVQFLDGNRRVVFQVPEDLNGDGTVLDSAGTIEWSPNTVTYALGGVDGNQVIRTQGAATRVLANGVTTLSFTPQGSETVQISVTARRGATTGDFPNQGTLTTRVHVRN